MEPLYRARQSLLLCFMEIGMDTAMRKPQFSHEADRVRLFKEMGIFSDAEADLWISRLTDAERFWSVEKTYLPEEFREAARTYLRTLPNPLWEEPQWARYEASLDAYVGVRAISHRERAELSDAFYDRDDQAGDGADIQGDEDEADEGPEFEGIDIRETIVGPSEYVNGICVTSVQLCADGIKLTWHARDVRSDRDFYWPINSATDDLGNTYLLAETSSDSLGESQRVGWSGFTPALVAGATRLQIEIENSAAGLVLDLRSLNAARREGP